MKIECVSCHHQIDAEARICPYCGADPRTGQRFDPKPLLEKHFPRREELTSSERALEFFRERQGIVVTVAVAILFVALVSLHQFITRRNLSQSSDVPAIPLTEVADLSGRAGQPEEATIPQLDFQYVGSPQGFRTLLVEPGAVAPVAPPDLTADNPTLERFTTPRRPIQPRPRPPATEITDEAYGAPHLTDTATPLSPSTENEPEPDPPPTGTEEPSSPQKEIEN